MGFDPDSIKKPRLLPENLPENASREDKITALANQLHDRGLTASVADAKRLAEGMVDTESKVMKDTATRDTDVTEMRKTLQSGSQLFDSILSDEDRFRQSLPEEFRRFIDKSISHSFESAAPLAAAEAAPAPQLPRASAQSQVFFSEAPSSSQVRGYKAEEFLNIPIPPSSPGESETVVEESDDAVVASHTESTPESYTMMDVGIFKEDEPLGEAAEESIQKEPDELVEDELEEAEVDTPEESSENSEEEIASEVEEAAEEIEGETAETEEESSSESDDRGVEEELEEPVSEKPAAPEQPEVDLTNVFYTGSGTPSEPTQTKPEPTPPEPEERTEPPEQTPVADETPPEEPEEKKQDLAKEHGIDLYDIFKKKG